MKKKEKNGTGPAKMSARGVAVIVGAVMLIFFGCDTVRRKVAPVKNTMEVDEWLETEGSFAGGPEPVTQPPTEVTAPEKTDESMDPQEADAPVIFKPTRIPSNCVTVERDQTALHSGKLLLLDSQHSYTGHEGEIGDFSGKNDSYILRFGEMEIQPEVVDALNRMANAYQTVVETEDKLLVYSTVAASSAEGALYPDPLPDRATGYCVDLGYYTEDGYLQPMYSVDPWIEANAFNYGFVLSYTDAEEEVTGIEAAPYHLRYVGTAHSMLMRDMGLTLTEYLEAIKSHQTDDPLTYHDGNQLWSVYFVPATGGTTSVPVPKNGVYEISGNNEDGYIVVGKGDLGI